MPRFVILLHEVGNALERTRENHFDWMFETPGTDSNVLRTWSTAPVELATAWIELPAAPLADHRLEYLEIQGKIGGNRGIVTRLARGEYQLVEASPDRFAALLAWPGGSAQGDDQRKLLIERRRASDPVGEVTEGSSWLRLSG